MRNFIGGERKADRRQPRLQRVVRRYKCCLLLTTGATHCAQKGAPKKSYAEYEEARCCRVFNAVAPWLSSAPGNSAGEAHYNRLVLKLLSRLRSGSMLLADRGYDADWIRAFATEKGAWANVPPRCNRREPICFSPHLL